MDDGDWLGPEIDFTIARGIEDTEKISALRDYFCSRSESAVETTRSRINESLAEPMQLTKSEAESLFTGFVLTSVATQHEGGPTFADYSFRVECTPASRVLEGQRIGREAINRFGERDSETNETVLTATLPPGLKLDADTRVRPLSSDIRQLFFDADSVVRIANPYFDASDTVVGDIASLADRGVTTKILTRETQSDDERLTSTLNTIHDKISYENRKYLKVRDLYQKDSRTGRQSYATHAKIAIADESPCYVGSANLTDMSLSNNFELGVLLWGEIVNDAIEVFDSVFEDARRVTLPL